MRSFCTPVTPEVSCAMAPASRLVSSVGTSPVSRTTPCWVVALMSNGETCLESSSAVFTFEVVAASWEFSFTERSTSRIGAAPGARYTQIPAAITTTRNRRSTNPADPRPDG